MMQISPRHSDNGEAFVLFVFLQSNFFFTNRPVGLWLFLLSLYIYMFAYVTDIYDNDVKLSTTLLSTLQLQVPPLSTSLIQSSVPFPDEKSVAPEPEPSSSWWLPKLKPIGSIQQRPAEDNLSLALNPLPSLFPSLSHPLQSLSCATAASSTSIPFCSAPFGTTTITTNALVSTTTDTACGSRASCADAISTNTKMVLSLPEIQPKTHLAAANSNSAATCTTALPAISLSSSRPPATTDSSAAYGDYFVRFGISSLLALLFFDSHCCEYCSDSKILQGSVCPSSTWSVILLIRAQCRVLLP
jgi:hypothetical protein